MALLDNIPTELSVIINWYGIPLKCDNCDKFGFAVKKCNINSEYKLCYDCIIKCSDCDYFISNFSPLTIAEFNSMENIETDVFNYRLHEAMMIFNEEYNIMQHPIKFYSVGAKCHICHKKICNNCLYKIDPRGVGKKYSRNDYRCYACIKKCNDCNRVIQEYNQELCKDCRSDGRN